MKESNLTSSKAFVTFHKNSTPSFQFMFAEIERNLLLKSHQHRFDESTLNKGDCLKVLCNLHFRFFSHQVTRVDQNFLKY